MKLIPKKQNGGVVLSKRERSDRQALAESGLNPNAISPKGAIGPYQIMPNMYADYQAETGDTRPFESVRDFNQASNVRKWALDNIANADYIKGKLQTEDVRLAKIYGSYNWGKTNMANYLNDAKAKGQDIYNSTDWTKGLPSETRGYLNKILFRSDPTFEQDFHNIKTKPNYRYLK